MKKNKSENKKENKPKKENTYKFNFKAWIIASAFSIVSAGLGLANLILHFTDK